MTGLGEKLNFPVVFIAHLVLTYSVTLLRPVESFILVLGDFMLFVGETLQAFPRFFRRWGIFLKQCEFIGVTSLGVSAVAGMFMGGVMGYQLYNSFHLFGAEALLGGSIGVSMYRELAPVFTAIMVTGRAGAAIAAEIASMQLSEQVDALEVMAVDPMEFLVVPRVAAGVLMMPLLAMFFCAVASVAGAGVGCGIMGLEWQIYWAQYAKVVDAIDIIHLMVKSGVFGLVLTWISCYCGYRAHGGARAVGLATRNTVVASFLAVLFCDYILTSLLPFGFAKLKVL
jgi:phospholipid/cholesterol/gamma-HCH transport system permease protein